MENNLLSAPSVRGRAGRLLLFAAAFFAVFCFFPALCPASVSLVEGGKPSAVIVIPDEAALLEVYAAEELSEHIEKASGAALPIVRESNAPAEGSRIFVGVTESARRKGIEPESLGVDEAVLLTIDSDLYVAGNISPQEADPLDIYTRPSGTLFGVYEIIERYLHVVWAWPGELGRYVPAVEDLIIADALDEVYSPPLLRRGMGGRYTVRIARGEIGYDSRRERIAFSREALEDYAHAAKTLLRRHRAGRGRGVPAVGHEFGSWWNRYGDEHPEWFMLNEEGRRGPFPAHRTHNVAMCVSNPDLPEYVARRWDAGRTTLRVGEVDGRRFCLCDECFSWDARQPREEDLPHFLRGEMTVYHPRVVSDRYARFWKSVYDYAVKRNPDVNVSTFLYNNYFPAPVEFTELGEGIWGYFTPWKDPDITFFPMHDDAFEWLKNQWKGWADTGMSMVYRPNYLHDGYAMPYLNTKQTGEMFKYAFENGMKGAQFDTLCGEWAVQGPMLYMHLRLLAKPYLEVEEVLDEYYSVFGPAEEDVRAYFGYWEDYAQENFQRINDIYRDWGAGRWRRFNLRSHEAFPPESFVPAEEILERAIEAAADSENVSYLERVFFLKAGLEHAKLAARLAAVFDGELEIPRGTERFRRAQQALAELVRFRRAHGHMKIFDFAHLASKELRADSWNLNALFE